MNKGNKNMAEVAMNTEKSHYVDPNGLLFNPKGALDARFDLSDMKKARIRYRALLEEQERWNAERESRSKSGERGKVELQVFVIVLLSCSFVVVLISIIKWY